MYCTLKFRSLSKVFTASVGRMTQCSADTSTWHSFKHSATTSSYFVIAIRKVWQLLRLDSFQHQTTLFVFSLRFSCHPFRCTSTSNMSRSCTSLALRVLLLITAVYGAVTNHNGDGNRDIDTPNALLKKSREISISTVTDQEALYSALIESQSIPSGIRRLLLSIMIHTFQSIMTHIFSI